METRRIANAVMREFPGIPIECVDASRTPFDDGQDVIFLWVDGQRHSGYSSDDAKTLYRAVRTQARRIARGA